MYRGHVRKNSRKSKGLCQVLDNVDVDVDVIFGVMFLQPIMLSYMFSSEIFPLCR